MFPKEKHFGCPTNSRFLKFVAEITPHFFSLVQNGSVPPFRHKPNHAVSMPRSTRACPSLEEDQPQFKLGQYLRIKEQDKPAWHHAWVTHVYPCSIRIEYDDNEGTRDQILASEYEARVRLPSFCLSHLRIAPLMAPCSLGDAEFGIAGKRARTSPSQRQLKQPSQSAGPLSCFLSFGVLPALLRVALGNSQFGLAGPSAPRFRE